MAQCREMKGLRHWPLRLVRTVFGKSPLNDGRRAVQFRRGQRKQGAAETSGHQYLDIAEQCRSVTYAGCHHVWKRDERAVVRIR